jgi:hypothetical protein
VGISCFVYERSNTTERLIVFAESPPNSHLFPAVPIEAMYTKDNVSRHGTAVKANLDIMLEFKATE